MVTFLHTLFKMFLSVFIPMQTVCQNLFICLLKIIWNKNIFSKRVHFFFLGSSAEQTKSSQTQTADDGIFSKIKKALMG